MRRKRLFVGVLVIAIVCFSSLSAMATVSPWPLSGRWFQLKAAVKGYNVNKVTGDIQRHNFTVPLYMYFNWNTLNSWYDVCLFTETAPGVWTNTWCTTSVVHQHFIRHSYLLVYVSTTDWFEMYHTPFIKNVLDERHQWRKATYFGIGEVIGGSFDVGESDCLGSVTISGKTVNKLPFTPSSTPSVPGDESGVGSSFVSNDF